MWINISTNRKRDDITYQGISQNIKKIAKKAGVKKKVTPHVFRHSRATHLAKMLTEAEMNVYFGWIQGSNMPATYVHLSGKDVDDKILQIHDLKSKDEEKQNEMKAVQCPKCKYVCSPTDRFCARCGTILDEGERIQLDIQSKQLAKDYPDLAIEDPSILQEMKKFIEMIELFEKKPELLNRVRAIAEGKN